MTDQVLNILKFVLLGMLYLFFARVLWAVWSEVRTPRGPVADARGGAARQPSAAAAAAPTTPTARAATPARGKAKRGLTFALSGELTLGRDPSCAIPIEDDSYVSQLHLRFYDYEGQPMVEDLGSTNGTFLNGNRLHGAKLLHPGDRIQVGTNVIEAQ